MTGQYWCTLSYELRIALFFLATTPCLLPTAFRFEEPQVQKTGLALRLFLVAESFS